MIKNVSEVNSVPFGFITPVGSSQNYKVYYDYPCFYVQNIHNEIFSLEDDDIEKIKANELKEKINSWVKEIKINYKPTF